MPTVVYPKNIRCWFYSAIYLVCSGCVVASELVWRNESAPWLVTACFWLVVILFFAGAAYCAYPAAFIFSHRLRLLSIKHFRHAQVFSGRVDSIEVTGGLQAKDQKKSFVPCCAHLTYTDASGMQHSIVSELFLYFKEEKIRQDALLSGDISPDIFVYERQGKMVYVVDLTLFYGMRFMYQRMNPWRMGYRVD